MYITTTGLILRETPYKESSKMLTVLTASNGKLSVSAKGALRRGSRTAAATQLLSCSELTLFSGKGGWTVTEARSIELFSGLRDDLALLTLGTYFAEILETLTGEDVLEPELLTLGLNGLYALNEKKRPPELIKAAFEMRVLCISGFEPLLESCAVCGEENPAEPCFNTAGGILHCRDCPTENQASSLPLCSGSLAALRHIASSEPKRFCSFVLGGEALKRLGAATEAYVKTQLERDFGTLDFYKQYALPVTEG